MTNVNDPENLTEKRRSYIDSFIKFAEENAFHVRKV
jgi:hypothetical protein